MLITKRSTVIAGSTSCWTSKVWISPTIRVPSSRKSRGMRACRRRKSARCRRCSGATRITSSIEARSAQFAWRNFKWETCSGSWSACIATTPTASINGSRLRRRVPAAGTRTIGSPNDPLLFPVSFTTDQPYNITNFPIWQFLTLFYLFTLLGSK